MSAVDVDALNFKTDARDQRASRRARHQNLIEAEGACLDSAFSFYRSKSFYLSSDDMPTSPPFCQTFSTNPLPYRSEVDAWVYDEFIPSVTFYMEDVDVAYVCVRGPQYLEHRFEVDAFASWIKERLHHDPSERAQAEPEVPEILDLEVMCTQTRG